MKTAIVDEVRLAAPPPPPPQSQTSIRRWAASFWLNYFFWHAKRFPWIVRKTKWFYLWFAVRFSKVIQTSTRANATRIFQRQLSDREAFQFTSDVVSSFYDFVYDIGLSLNSSTEQIRGRITSVEGSEHYMQARQLKRGAIIATAHMGSFEVGTAALLQLETHVHVVFKRDSRDWFEQIRSKMRHKLGVIEAPIDEGWSIWMKLREALMRDEVVMLQADRVMPGQKGAKVRFLGGHLLIPTGPVKLAMATGAPLIPVFTVRTSEGKIRLIVEKAIIAEDAQAALEELARTIERIVAKHPQQWLLLQPAFIEDAGGVVQ